MRARSVPLLLCLAACGGGADAADPDASATVADAGAEPRSDASAGTSASCDESEHRGEGTYYAADGSGNCSFDASPQDLRVAAMNHVDYAGSAVCGACVRVSGPSGAVTVRIVDQCPECAQGDLDLSPQAFDGIAARSLGRVAIRWQFVPCAVTGSLRYRFKEGSSQWWTAVQVRNHRHAIAKLEVEKNGSFVVVPRLDYNYFVDASGMGPGPYTFRVTDVYGGQWTDRNVALRVASEVGGAGQLPVCGGG